MTWRHVLVLGLVAALPTVAAGGSAAAETRAGTAAAAAPPARVVAVVPVGTRSAKLTLLDARTLKPVRRGWSRAAQSMDAPAALSPARSRVAVIFDGSESVLALDATTGKVVERYPDAWGEDLYWLGGDGTPVRYRPPLLLAVGVSCASQFCGLEVQAITPFGGNSGGGSSVFEKLDVVSVLRDGLVLAPPTPTALVVFPNVTIYGRERPEIELARLPAEAPFRVVADVLHDRLYVISSGSMVATITRASSAKPVVAYHRVPLNGKPFDAAWAGSGKIGLWGEDGLGTIDVRTWKTHAIAPGISGALATPYGIAAWMKTTDGIRVYKADGTRRFQRLQGKQITAARAVGPYLYADTTARTRYAIDLRTGKATGPLPTTAKIVTPTLVTIP